MMLIVSATQISSLRKSKKGYILFRVFPGIASLSQPGLHGLAAQALWFVHISFNKPQSSWAEWCSLNTVTGEMVLVERILGKLSASYIASPEVAVSHSEGDFENSNLQIVEGEEDRHLT